MNNYISAIKEAIQCLNYGHMQHSGSTGGSWKRTDHGKTQNRDAQDTIFFSAKYCRIKLEAL